MNENTIKKITTVLVGLGRYGTKIAKYILPRMEEIGMEIAGVVDPGYDYSPMKEEMDRLQVPHYATLEEFYAEHKADLAILSSPIQFHEAHCITAMRNGSDCLCEKPTAATVAQSDRMAAVAAETGRTLHIGFQLSYAPAILALKEDILNGKFGKPISMDSLTCWPRDSEYYARPWCAKLYMDGQPVLDSIAMNACAHYLHAVFFLLGDRMDRSAMPAQIESLLCRANDIETFDTALLKLTVKGVPFHFMATHTTAGRFEPMVRLRFEKATVEISDWAENDYVRVTYPDGTAKDYGKVRPELFRKIPYCCDVIRGLEKPICTPETAKPHLLCINAITQLTPVQTLTETEVVNDVVVVKGLEETLREAYETNKMPWELTDRFGAPTHIELAGYTGWREE